MAPSTVPTFLHFTHNAVGCSVAGWDIHTICSSAAISERLTEPSVGTGTIPRSYEEAEEEEETRLDGLHRELVSASCGAA